MNITNRQREVIYGSLLGDMSILERNGDKHRIKIGHTENQLDYLLWKKKELFDFFLQKEPNCEKPKSGYGTNMFYSFTSTQQQEFSYISSLFYRKKKGKRVKVVTRKILDKVGVLGLLVWFLDDGCLVPIDKEKRKRSGTSIRFATNCFTESEHKAMKKWFWQKWRIRVQIDKNNHNNSFFLRLRTKDTYSLLDLFEPYMQEIPECMHYKLLR
jgi:hypothetical protein